MNTVKETMISDITLYNMSTTEQHRDMLNRYGLSTNVLFFLAYKLFNEYGSKKVQGEVPAMLDSATATTMINTAPPIQYIIKTRFESSKGTMHNNMNFNMFRENVHRAIFQMYYAAYNQFALLYSGVLDKYRLRGAILDITNFRLLSVDRVIYDVYDTFTC